MSIQEIFDASGGGWIGLLFTLLVAVVALYYWDLKAQIRDYKAENKEMRTELSRLTDVVEASIALEGQRGRPRRS